MSHPFSTSGRTHAPFEHPLIAPSEARQQFTLSLAVMAVFLVVVCALSFASWS